MTGMHAGGTLSNQQSRARTIFHRALEASKLTWKDRHLQQILDHDINIDAADRQSDLYDCRGVPLWIGRPLVLYTVFLHGLFTGKALSSVILERKERTFVVFMLQVRYLIV